jgi:hypothetical protein
MLRTGSALAQASTELLFVKTHKSHVAESAAVAARGFKGGRFRLFGQTFKAQRDRQNGPHIDECVASFARRLPEPRAHGRRRDKAGR